MKVRELIATLRDLPQDADVSLSSNADGEPELVQMTQVEIFQLRNEQLITIAKALDH